MSSTAGVSSSTLLPPPPPSFDVLDPSLEANEEVRRRDRTSTTARRALLTLPIDPVGVLNSTATSEDEDVIPDTDDDLHFDLYKSPCLIRASNDEFTFAQHEAFSESCGDTFFGGCFNNETELIAAMAQSEIAGGGEDGGVVAWTIMFDYEVYYPSNVVDPIPAIQHLETIVLEHLSKVTTLNQCNGTDDTTARLLQTTSEFSHDFSEDDLKRMIAISGDPIDTLDPDYGTCNVPQWTIYLATLNCLVASYLVTALWYRTSARFSLVLSFPSPTSFVSISASCMVPVPASISETSNCMPVTGAFRLYLNNTGVPSEEEQTQKLAIESGFQRLIRFGMRQGLYNSGDVTYASFIGTRLEDAVPPAPLPSAGPVPDVSGDNNTVSNQGSDADDMDVDGSTNSNKTSSVNDLESNGSSTNASSPGTVEGQKAGIIIGSVGAVVLCLLVWSLLAVRRRKQAVAAAARDESDDSSDLEDAEEGLKSMPSDDMAVIPTNRGRATQERTRVPVKSMMPTLASSSTSFSDILPKTLMADTMEDDDEYVFNYSNDESRVKIGSVRVFQDNDDDDNEGEDHYSRPEF